MLQLATQSTQVPLNSRPVDNPRAAPAPSSTLRRSCFGPAWRSPLQFAISTIGNSAGLIGAGYMIVNELALTGAGYGANAHSRQPCGADPSSSRSPTRARGILVSPRLCREGINSDTQAFAEHKIISDGQDHRDRSGTRTHGSLTPDIGGVSKDFPRRPIFHKNKDLHPCASMDRPKWWSKWCQTHS
jgi:hypothetical protein